MGSEKARTPYFFVTRAPAGAGGASWGRQAFGVILAELAVVCALWEHGSPLFTFVLLGLLPLGAVFARIPPRFCPRIVQSTIRLLVGLLLLAWFLLRLRQAPADVALVELTAGLLFPLLLAPTRRAYALGFVLTLLLVGYGGLVPTRPLYLPAAVAYILVGLVGLYATRTEHLAGGRLGSVSDRHSGTRRRVAAARAIFHFAAIAGIWYAAVVMAPRPWHGSAGLAPVSFRSWQTFDAPRFWRRWFPWGRTEPGNGPKDADKAGGTPQPGKSRSGRMIEGSWLSRYSLSSKQAVGRGAAGRDLVFRVRCDYKLYWLARLYDVYDGARWRTSQALSRAHVVDWARSRGALDAGREVFQSFEVEKAVSRRLFSAFCFKELTAAGFQTASPPGTEVRVLVDGSGPRLGAGELPRTPWRYDCISRIVRLPEAPRGAADGIPGNAWKDPLPRRHYLALPRGCVSPRVRELARTITAAAHTDLDKAVALRDWLRTHCRYTLKPPRTPPQADPVEFFLLVSREGYCLHFAEALTVLARISGLPARMAAGYAPGNYNLLTGYFEVYEYHAHAWAQIFVCPYGWLTFDGVPPAQLPIRTTPSLLGRFRDPFGADWSARPPELAAVQRLVAANRETGRTDADAEGAERETAAGEMSDFMAKVYDRADKLARGAAPGAFELALAAGAVFWENLGNFMRGLRKDFAIWIGRMTGAAWARIRWGGEAVWTLVAHHWFFVLLGCGGGGLLVGFRRRLRRWFERLRRRRRCRILGNMLEGGEGTVTPEKRVCLAAELVSELLALRGIPRSPTQDLGEFARWVGRRRPAWGREVQVVSTALARALFSARRPSAEEVDAAVQAALRLRDALRMGRDTRRGVRLDI